MATRLVRCLVGAVLLAATGCSAGSADPSADPSTGTAAQPASPESPSQPSSKGPSPTQPGRSAEAEPSADPEPSAGAEPSADPKPSTDPEPSADPEPAAQTGWGLSVAQVERARRAVARMSLAEKAGQVIVARYAGTAAPTALVRRYHLAGVIVMGDNVGSVAAVRRSNATLQRADDRDWPLLIGVDQEGGIVDRLEAPMTAFPALMTHGASARRDLAAAAAAASGVELRAAGFTTVFAPVADVTSGAGDPTIGSRSAGSDPRQVSRVVTAALRGYRGAGIVAVAKHFPGHGSVGTDSHLGLPVQPASLRTLRGRDLAPFRAAVDAGAPAVMMGHLDVRAVDPGTPSSLSRRVVTGLLRKRLGFEGLVVTDALEMGAIVEGYGTGNATVRALRAGVDTVLMPADLPAAHAAVVAAVRSGRLSPARLDEAATRTVALQMHAGQRPGRRPPPRVIGSHDAVSQRASRAAVTVVRGRCSGRLVGGSVEVSGDSAAVAAFEAAAARRGLDTTGGSSVVLLGYADSAATGDVVVATDTPYVLGQSDAATKIATYGDTPGAMTALVDVLLGRAQAPGRLPVEVDGVARPGC